MSKNNTKAWEQIKRDGLTVDVQVYPNDDGSHTAYVGTVYNDRSFAGTGFMGKKKYTDEAEARRDTRAAARAISRETGIPLHPSVPSERHKQVPSYTIGRAQSKVLHEAQQRQAQTEWEESLQGKLYLVIAALILGSLFIGVMLAMGFILSLIENL